MDEGSFTELFVEAVREFGRVTARREAAQRAAECVVERVGRFSGDDVPSYMEAYNEEMSARDVDEALRLEFFCRIAAPWIQAEVKELGGGPHLVGSLRRGTLAEIRRTTEKPKPARL